MKGLTGNRGAIAQWRGAECSALERGERRPEKQFFPGDRSLSSACDRPAGKTGQTLGNPVDGNALIVQFLLTRYIRKTGQINPDTETTWPLKDLDRH